MSELRLRPLVREDEGELRRIRRQPEVLRWWDELEGGFPWEEPASTRLTIEIDGAVAGLIQYYEETEPKYRHGGLDLFLAAEWQGQGFGTEAVRQVVALLVDERGHHRVQIDPAAGNVAAIRAYEKAGFRRVGVMRRAERDVGGGGWHDALLMEFVVE